MSNREFWDLFALTMVTILHWPYLLAITDIQQPAYIIYLFWANICCLVAAWVQAYSLIEARISND